jgi:hypothetical protein
MESPPPYHFEWPQRIKRGTGRTGGKKENGILAKTGSGTVPGNFPFGKTVSVKQNLSGNQRIGLCLLGPLTIRVISLKDFQPQLQFLGIMARLVLSHPEIVLSLGSRVCLRKTNQNLLEALHGLLKVIEFELRFTLPENDLADEIFRRQIPDEAVVLLSIRIQDDYGRSPFNGIALHQGLVFVKINLESNEAISH